MHHPAAFVSLLHQKKRQSRYEDATMRRSTSTSTQKSPRPSARRLTSSSQVGRRSTSTRATDRAASVPYCATSARNEGSPLTVSSDVFEIVADGNADVLTEMIAFSGARHMSELRSKKQEDYGRNLLHCAVASGQLKALQVLLKHDVFDPNQVDSVYTRSTPMMEAVKIGRLDLIECLIAAGARLDVQDVNGDSVLHWAAREVSAAFLRQVLHLARRHGKTVPQLQAALQLNNNSGENAAGVGANDVARESIRRLVSGEETPGLPAKKKNPVSTRPSQAGAGVAGVSKTAERASYAGGGGGGGGGSRPSQSAGPTGLGPSQSSSQAGLRSSDSGGLRSERARPGSAAQQPQPQASTAKRNHRWGSAAPLTTPTPADSGGVPAGMPDGVMVGRMTAGRARVTAAPPQDPMVEAGGAAAGRPLLMPQQVALLPKVKGVGENTAISAGGAYILADPDDDRVRASSTPALPRAQVQESLT